MRLEKRKEGLCIEAESKAGKRRHEKKPCDEVGSLFLPVFHMSKPFLLMQVEHREPFIESWNTDEEKRTNGLHSLRAMQIESDSAEDKGEGVKPVRNDRNRQDGVCMPAIAADEAFDPHLVAGL